MVRPDAIVMLNALVVLTDMASVTCAVKLKVPELLGVPLIIAPLSVRPPGSAPNVIDHV